MTEDAGQSKSALPEIRVPGRNAAVVGDSSASGGMFSLRRAHYFVNATKLEGLSGDEQRVSSQMIGDADAKQKMIIEHRHLVAEIAKRYINRGISFFDLVKQGETGLFHALDNFELEGGFRFATYASWCIRQAIERVLMEQEIQYGQAEASHSTDMAFSRQKVVTVRNTQSHHQRT